MNLRYLPATNTDKNNCVPLALAAATNMPLAEATEVCRVRGRLHGHGTPTFVTRAIFGAYGKSVELRHRITAERFCRLHPVGRFILRKSGHAFAIVNGKISDHTRRRSLIREYWVVNADAVRPDPMAEVNAALYAMLRPRIETAFAAPIIPAQIAAPITNRPALPPQQLPLF